MKIGVLSDTHGNFVLCVFTLLLFTLPDLIQQNFSIPYPRCLRGAHAAGEPPAMLGMLNIFGMSGFSLHRYRSSWSMEEKVCLYHPFSRP